MNVFQICGAISATCVVVVITLAALICALAKIRELWAERQWHRVQDRLYGELYGMSRHCSSIPLVSAVSERIEAIIDEQPVESLADFYDAIKSGRYDK